MKRVITAIAASALAIWLAAQVGAPSNRPLATLFPAGPWLYLEAKDFQALMRDWNGSQEKRLWLASDNYNVFSRSNLFLKLQHAQEEFASAAGVPPDMALLANIAGSESALAIYDIGKLQFLYITRMPSARLTDSSLWKARANYEPRKAAGLDYYVRFDKASDRTAAFAAAKDYLLMATREDVLAGALALIAQQNVPGMSGEPWFARGVQTAKTPGELRLVLNIPALLQSPYMRSYWIQRNASELKQYNAAISDATRNASEIREERTLFRESPEPPSWNENAVAQIVRLAPANAGLYRAWASPTKEQAFALIREKLLELQPGPAANRRAPDAGSMDATAGSEADLETRIDEPPLETAASPVPNAFARVGKIEAMLYIASTRVLPDGVFVGIDSAVVLLGDVAAARTALASSGLHLAGTGTLLIAGNRPEFVQALLANAAKPPTPTAARYAAAYQHTSELPNFVRLTRLIDNPLKQDSPMFFSQNVAGLGTSILGRMDAASIAIHDAGDTVTQKLIYKTKP